MDFTSPVSREQAGTTNVEGALYYASSAFVPELNMALDHLGITSADSILDYGSGKGAVLVRFSDYPFRRICGIELSATLNAICRRNLQKLRLEKIEVLQGDAAGFSDINDFNYFYFFNPFSGQVFESVIQNIVNSYDATPRPLTIIYYHPKCHDIIMGSGRFRLAKQFTDAARTLNIYKIGVQ